MNPLKSMSAICIVAISCVFWGCSDRDSDCQDVCLNETTLRLCSRDVPLTCANGCLDGMCLECINQSMLCQNDTLYECNANTWQEIKTCAFGCDGNACGVAYNTCRSNTTKCEDGIMYVCTDDAWIKTNECSNGCNLDTRACNACEDGVRRCENNIEYICLNGSWSTARECALECGDQKCATCQENASKCENDAAYICQDDAWQFVEHCIYGCDGETSCKGCYENSQRCENSITYVCLDNTWQKSKECDFGCNRDTCRACAEKTFSCDEKFRTQCIDGAPKKIEFCELGCVQGECLVDTNDNHLYDLYETAEDNDKPCLSNGDCTQLCYGEKCTSKCTDDTQCMDGYACRNDGICVNSDFIFSFKLSEDALSVNIPTDKLSNCQFTIKWNDLDKNGIEAGNNVEVFDSCPPILTHTYKTAGTKTITITGTLDGFTLCKDMSETDGCTQSAMSGELTIQSFGKINFAPYAFALTEISSLPQTDIPYDMTYMFQKATILGDITNLDISHVKLMYGTFMGANIKVSSLSSWNVSNVKSFANVFNGCNAIKNLDLSSWNTSSAENMEGMFSNTSFNGNIGTWNVQNVVTMREMFLNNPTFNQDISQWTVSKLRDIRQMFKGAASFNQNLSSWNLPELEDSSDNMTDLFKNSGISQENYCSMLEKIAIFKKYQNILGLEVTCG